MPNLTLRHGIPTIEQRRTWEGGGEVPKTFPRYITVPTPLQRVRTTEQRDTHLPRLILSAFLCSIPKVGKADIGAQFLPGRVAKGYVPT